MTTSSAATAPRHHRGRHRLVSDRTAFWLAMGAVLAVCVLASWLVLTAPARPAAAAPQTPTAPLPLVRYATVTSVRSGDTVVVDGTQTVRVVGLQAPAPGQCGYGEAVDHARAQLSGHRVTLVPDPAAPDAGAHVVMASQESFADEALMAGMGRVAPGGSTYRDVELREQQQAQKARVGLWRTCWAGER